MPSVLDLLVKFDNARRQKESCTDWLKEALQNAISLEFATIPPYLCALWSIKDERHPVAESIRRVVQQEMLHFALACNMLVSIGGSPRISDPNFAPVYPGNLPGGVHPELSVPLSGLNEDSLKVFMKIEEPEKISEAVREIPSVESQEDDTIGKFYDCINAAFHAINPALSTDRQMTGPLSWIVMTALEDVDEAIELIKKQGEGSEDKPIGSTGVVDLAHYYRFEEIYKRQRLEWDGETKKWEYRERINLSYQDDVWPMAAVPEGGYQQNGVTKDTWHLLKSFDEAYTNILDLLTSAWSDGGQAALIRAVESMFTLQTYARQLMQISIPGGEKRYGPCFRLRREKP